MALSRFSEIDEYGFKRGEGFDPEKYEQFMSTYLKILAKRRSRWEGILRKNIDLTKVTRTLKRFIRKGIPSPYRADVWMKTSGAYLYQKRSPKLYQNLLKGKFERDVVESIQLDLPRTFPDNLFFNGIKNQLFNVLIAYAHHNREIGYCQGLNYVAGLLLIVTKSEEISFWLLKIIVENIVSEYHTKTMKNLIKDIAVLKELVVQYMPEGNTNIESLGLPYAVIASKWFICLFSEVLPTETVLRIWDCLFAEGYKILFRVGLTLFVLNKNEICKANDISILANLFKNEITNNYIVLDCNNFIQSIFKIPGNLKRREIERLRQKCDGRKDIV